MQQIPLELPLHVVDVGAQANTEVVGLKFKPYTLGFASNVVLTSTSLHVQISWWPGTETLFEDPLITELA